MRREIGAKPALLRRTCFAAADVFAFTVQNDDVPRAEIVAVVAGLGIASENAEIVEVGRCTCCVEFMIARCRPGARSCTAPGFVVALEIFFRAVRVSEVARGEDRTRNLIEQPGRGFRASESLAVGNVTGSDEDYGLPGS